MKLLLVTGVLLMLIGAGLMIKGSWSTREKHEANVFGATLSVTGKSEKKIPLALSGTILGVGVVLTLAAASKIVKGGKED